MTREEYALFVLSFLHIVVGIVAAVVAKIVAKKVE